MLKMFRRKRRERDSDDRTTFQAQAGGQHSHIEHINATSTRKTRGTTFELLPVTRDGNSVIRGALLPPPILNNTGKPRYSAPPPAQPSFANDNTALVSFIHFRDVVDLNPSSPSDTTTCPPTPALVYTAGGKAKSMYTVAGPASIRKFRDSTISQPPGTPATLPSTRIPPVPALKLPSVKARHKQIPTFNVCVAGAPSTGKSSFIRLLCETLDLDKQKESTRKGWETVRHPSYGKTAGPIDNNSLSLVVTTAFEQRIRLTLHDAESFAFSTDTSLNLQSDLKALDLARFIEGKMDASIAQESALVRQPLTSTDSHVHLCLYFLDQTCSTVSKTTLNSENKYPETKSNELVVTSHHLNVIKQISRRVNVIPIIARADEFTITQLEAAKSSLRMLSSAGLVMDPLSFTQSGSHTDEGYRSIGRLLASGVQSDSEAEDTEENVPVTPVIKSRSNSIHNTPARRRRNKRFSEIAIKPSEEDIGSIFPVSLITPESFDTSDNHPFTARDYLKNSAGPRYTRQFKYGTVDVENEDHCEFAGLKRVLFTTGWKTLKEMTEDKFEEFRTERLQERQARSRATTITRSA